MRKYDEYGISKNREFLDLVLKMLEPDPMRRITPRDILNHPFVAEFSKDL